MVDKRFNQEAEPRDGHSLFMRCHVHAYTAVIRTAFLVLELSGPPHRQLARSTSCDVVCSKRARSICYLVRRGCGPALIQFEYCDTVWFLSIQFHSDGARSAKSLAVHFKYLAGSQGIPTSAVAQETQLSCPTHVPVCKTSVSRLPACCALMHRLLTLQ